MTATLVIGGARSGKSAHAEALAASSGKKVVYLATAHARDAEMAARIALHRQRRQADWISVEEPLALGAAIARWGAPDCVVLVDCLTVWLSNLLFSEQRDYPDVGVIMPPPAFSRERQALLESLEQAGGDVILVSNEVGMGIVPQGAISRWFVDEAGRLNQAVAVRCDCAVLMVAGLPMQLKGAA
ncbi:bifunctional adenosylcobinamide kinase/adenosylcobinamide-phosphate guanylyltransferase [Noviherbaspirillum saxi]|uniref:Bifunctional adenosylcobalamin biosynthesis protein n=1 Tax=Noviherbaspirillum saxi TaxID=2320863 RepID=A0A3A3FU99_9BURK|nr:bifunctional adenosylcobinamide kinase/adenosylcobinamide-phosphate guanylyltransferase [Noviherbaspirillum saxi]RJF98098.1 bifunctional adenosylcobinamide kinase/adenosylcobinamide-phosphate guanylyltransferase [Noviherbaspirillum saxi]